MGYKDDDVVDDLFFVLVCWWLRVECVVHTDVPIDPIV